MKKDFNYNIAFIRTIFCIAILLYHLNILKGGYLAVCSFFVLTGYFSCKSLGSSKSIINYYLKRIKKIYIPLLIVVFSTISLLVILKHNIFNFKPEITSIIFGYNNYYQLSVNADYFAKHISTPFMHLWYIGILLQLELVFPFIYLILKKLAKNINIYISLLIVSFFAIISTVYFYKSSLSGNIMNTYYDTIIRSFSFIYGVLLYYIHISLKKVLIFIKNSKFNIFIFTMYLLILLYMFIFIDSKSKYFAISMILTSFITMRLIEYSILLHKKNKEINSRLITFISNISYEIYLIQYPVIYLFLSIKINYVLKIISIILITIILSAIIHFILNISSKKRLKIIRLIVFISILLTTFCGIYNYIIMKDYTDEINNLKKDMETNEKIMKQKQKEYLEKSKQEKKDLEEYINSLELDEEKLHEYVKNLKVVGIGDSVMVDPVSVLYNEFPNGYFDALVSRSTCAGADVLNDIKNKGITWDVLVFNLGTNGYPNDKCKDKLMQYVNDDIPVFWLNTTHPDYDNNNEELEKYAAKHENIHVLDWDSYIKNHPEYLYSDYTHLKPNGVKPYVEFIKEAIYNYYLEEYNNKKQSSIDEYKKKQPLKYNFFGNELLINIYNELSSEYSNSEFIANNNMNYNELLNILKEDSNLNSKLIFIFDDNSKITENNYLEIAKIYEEKEIYIVTFEPLNIDNQNVKIIEIKLGKEDLLKDNIHLSDKGNKKLFTKIKEILK